VWAKKASIRSGRYWIRLSWFFTTAVPVPDTDQSGDRYPARTFA
jgi:hypothetical protein